MPSAGLRRRNEAAARIVATVRRADQEEVRAALRPPVMADHTVTATDATFASLIAGDKPVLVDFWAPWCGPCRMVAPFLDEIAAEYPTKITIAKLNVDENPQTAMQFDVMSIPTILVFRNGRPTGTRIVGARPKAALLQDLAAYLA